MFVKKLLIIIPILIFLLCSTPIYSINIENNFFEINKFNTIFVDDDNIIGPWEGTREYPYCKIQDAINNSEEYDYISVEDGIYKENLLINKSLILFGENSNNTIIDGNFVNNIIRVTKDEVSIINFTIRNTGGGNRDTGIFLDSNNSEIKDCILYNSKYGIIINQSYNKVNNCSFRKNGYALSLFSVSNIFIDNCSFDHNSIGLNIDNSNDIITKYCFLYGNGISCFFNNSNYLDFYHCNVSDNSVNIGGIFIISCRNININNSNVNHNGVGFGISSSDSINIMNCNINQNTHFAISMRTSSKNVLIESNIIKNNKRIGIYIEENNQCEINNNNIFDNYLCDIYSKFSYCNAQNNWWGTKLGPINLKNILNNKIKTKGGWILFLPWTLKKYNDVGSTWNSNHISMNSKEFLIENYKIEFNQNDSDNDGLPDWWEQKWGYNIDNWDDHINLDQDNDSLNNFEECFTDKWGSNPYYKDIFLELDWMKTSNSNKSNKPSMNLINEIIKSFENHDINLHVDLGELGGGEELDNICTPFLSFPKLTDIYFNYFLNNDLRNPRKGIFHYGIICNECPDLNFPFYGWDSFDSFAISAEWLQDENPTIKRSDLIVGAAIHHLGHTLKLHADVFDGIDNIYTINPFSSQYWIYNDYISCMNYRYKYKIFTFSEGENKKGDFNDWLNMDFSFFKNTNFN